jgi:site-specific recombinase XerD
MSDLAQVFRFPGVDAAPGDRPATFNEYLRSLNLAPNTIYNSERLLAIAEDRALRKGVDLETMDGDTLNRLIEEGNSDWSTNQLRTALNHFYRWRGLVMPRPEVAKLTPIPGVGVGPGDRPATYDEYLVSIGLAANTIRNYVWRLKRAETTLADLGATLLTADAFQLAAMSASTPTTHSFRGQLRCAIKHFYEWQNRQPVDPM